MQINLRMVPRYLNWESALRITCHGELQKAVIEVGKADPNKPIDDIIKEAKSVKKTRLKISPSVLKSTGD